MTSQQKKKINLFEILEILEKHEKWVNSDAEVNSAALKAINEISKFENKETKLFDTFAELSFLIETSAHLRFDLFLRLFNEIGIKQNGFGGDSLLFCYDGIYQEEDGSQQLKKEMNVVLQRIVLMIQAEVVSKVFGEENRKRVIEAIDRLTEKNN